MGLHSIIFVPFVVFTFFRKTLILYSSILMLPFYHYSNNNNSRLAEPLRSLTTRIKCMTSTNPKTKTKKKKDCFKLKKHNRFSFSLIGYFRRLVCQLAQYRFLLLRPLMSYWFAHMSNRGTNEVPSSAVDYAATDRNNIYNLIKIDFG